jgi:hypothetical protein
LRLAALNVIAERQMAAASDKVKALFADSDAEIRTAAYRAFARSVTPDTDAMQIMLTQLQTAKTRNRTTAEQDEIRESLRVLCRTMPEREAAADLLAVKLSNADMPTANFYLDLLFQLGGDKAAARLASVAMGSNDALTDTATQLLGRWTTPEVAPFLIDIAEKHPNERYRVRTLSGYLRVIRQMGLPVEQKVQMAEKALAIATRDADKQQAQAVLDRFKTMMLFDGKTFTGWEFRGNEKWFRIQDGAIVCGSLEESIPHNEFIVTTKEYGDFTLRVECKVLGKGANGGIQFRSVRAPADGNMPNEMIGYQADMTDTASYWGALYDESRRNRFLASPWHELVVTFYQNDWNEYEIVCKGNNIKLFLNGQLTVDYTEQDADIPARGFIGLQIHSGPPSEIWYRNIRIEE